MLEIRNNFFRKRLGKIKIQVKTQQMKHCTETPKDPAKQTLALQFGMNEDTLSLLHRSLFFCHNDFHTVNIILSIIFMH